MRPHAKVHPDGTVRGTRQRIQGGNTVTSGGTSLMFAGISQFHAEGHHPPHPQSLKKLQKISGSYRPQDAFKGQSCFGSTWVTFSILRWTFEYCVKPCIIMRTLQVEYEKMKRTCEVCSV